MRFAFGGLGDVAEQLEERRLARAVAADQPDDVAFLDAEGDVAQGPEVPRRVDGAGEHVADGHGQALAQNVRAIAADAVSLADAEGLDHRRHMRSANSRSMFLK